MSLKRVKIYMFVVLSLVYMVSFVQAVVMTVVANDIMLDMGLTPAGMGRLGSFYLYGYAGVMLFSGMITAWLGPRRTLTTLCLVSGIGGLMFANAESFYVAGIGRMLSGIGLSSNMTSAFTIFTRWYPAKIYPKLCAIFIAIGGIGTLLATAFLPTLNAHLGWRHLFGGIAVLTIIYSALVLLLVKDWPPADMECAPGSDMVQRVRVTPLLLWNSFKVVAKRLDFWRLVIWFCCLAGMFFSFAGLWAMPYLKEIYAMSHTEAGAITSVVSLGYIFGAPAVSWLSENVFRSYRVSLGGSGLLTIVVAIFLLIRIDSMATVTIFLLVLVMGMNVNAPTAVAHAAARNLFGAGMAGIVSGIFGCAAFLGGAVLQMVCGELLYLAQNLGWPAASCYALAFSPYILCGVLAGWAGFTLSPGSFPQTTVAPGAAKE